MKKLLGISIVAVLAVTPLMANADPVSVTLQGTNGVVAASNDVASTSYVKGAYNVLGEAINSLGTRVGDSTNGLVKDVADLKSGAGIVAGSITKTQLESTVQTSLGLADSALQKADITTGSENGTIAVEGTDVAVKGLGSAAFADTTAFDDAGAAAGVKSDIEGKLDDGVNGYDINAKSLQVQGANVLTENSSLSTTNIADKAITKAKLDDGVQASLGLADSAVQSVTTGTTGMANGTISVDGTEVAVKGLGSAAYTDSTAYATAAQGALADSAVQSVAEGTTNGTIAVDGAEVAVHGLGSAAYTSADAYDAAGAADIAEQNAKAHANQKVVTVQTKWDDPTATGTVALADSSAS